jgi:hypothetical protein
MHRSNAHPGQVDIVSECDPISAPLAVGRVPAGLN